MKRAFAALLASLALSAQGTPAPWYWWVSRYDTLRICAQTSPGDGWERSDGPFRDSRCTKRGM